MRVHVPEGGVAVFNNKGVSNTITGRQSFILPGGGSRPGSVNGETTNRSIIKLAASGITSEEDSAIKNDVIPGTETVFSDTNRGNAKAVANVIWP